MNDTRFKFLVTVVAIVFTAIAAMYFFSPDKSSRRTQRDKSLGEYVYIDGMNIVHIDRKCSRLNYKGMRSERVRVSDFAPSEYELYCPKCVDDQNFEKLTSR